MDKANQAFRRSSVKLKCLGSGHSELNMIISDLKEMKSTFKSFHLAQITTWEDLAKWANKGKTVALQEIFHVLLDLCYLWSEAQLDFIAGLKKFKHQFELILESETLLDKSKAHLTACEQRESKIRKELKKATTKSNIEEAKQLSDRQAESQALVKVAQAEVKSKASENEAVKLMLVKEGLINMSACYQGLAERGAMVFKAHKEVSKFLPDVHDKDIEDVRYQGAEGARNIVLKTKEWLEGYRKGRREVGESAPPPPYSPPAAYQPQLPAAPTASPGSAAGSSRSIGFLLPEYSSPPPPLHFSVGSDWRRSEPPLYDLPMDEDGPAEGAVGGYSLPGSSYGPRYANT